MGPQAKPQYQILMTNEEITDLHNFLSRVDLKGKEVFVFTNLVNKFNTNTRYVPPQKPVEVTTDKEKEVVADDE